MIDPSRKGARVRNTRPIAFTGALALVLAACGGSTPGADDRTGATGPPAERPSSTATLAIVSPRNGAVVTGTSVDLRVRLEGAKIVAQTTQRIEPDEGHLHVVLDGALISMTEGTEQTIPDLTTGLHRIQVEFVASDHVPFDPRVVSVVSFEVPP